MAEGDFLKANEFSLELHKGTHDFTTGSGHTFKARLLTGHTYDATDSQWSDVSANEASGTGYTAGGVTIAQRLTHSNGTTTVDFANPTWAGLDIGTPSHLVIINDSAANDEIVAYVELGRASNGGDYTVEINPSGLLTHS